VPGGLYHVILRGNGRQTIFFDADDRRRWESLIEEGVSRYAHRIHAYCWMTNHVHLAIQCHDIPLAKFMGFVASQYARSTNKKINRSGHFFERRHRAILVQADSYLIELIRYIHQNPLRAGMVDDLTDYQWSSHLPYLQGRQPNWLTLNWVLSMFGDTVANARREYTGFMQIACRKNIRQSLRHGTDDDHRILGDDSFRALFGPELIHPAVQRALKKLTQEICSKYKISESDLASTSRDPRYSRIRAEIGLAAIKGSIATNAEIARYFNRSQSGMSRAINGLRKQIQNK
jgi:REP element-mobilizing transposase RayT